MIARDAARAAGTAMVLLALVAGCERSSASGPPSVGPSSPVASANAPAGSPAAAPSAGPTIGAGDGKLVIETFDDPAIFGGPGLEVLRHPVSAGDGFAILGDVTVETKTHHEIWLSPDGTAWERVTSIPSMADAQVLDLVEMAGGRLLATGWKSTDGASTAWTSDDGGRSWTAAPMNDVPIGASARVVAAGPRGAIALGATPRTIGEVTEPVYGGNRLWWSPNGSAWSAVAMPDDVFGAIDIYDVAATPAGFVAVGGRFPAEPAPAGDPLRGVRAAAWVSADGMAWTAAEAEDGPPIIAVLPGSQGLLGIGYGQQVTGTVPWASLDGSSWVQQAATIETGNTYPAVWDGRIYMLRSRFGAEGSIVELSESLDGVDWRIAGEAVSNQVGGIGVTAPGVPGLIQLGGGDGDATVWLIRWPGR